MKPMARALVVTAGTTLLPRSLAENARAGCGVGVGEGLPDGLTLGLGLGLPDGLTLGLGDGKVLPNVPERIVTAASLIAIVVPLIIVGTFDSSSNLP